MSGFDDISRMGCPRAILTWVEQTRFQTEERQAARRLNGLPTRSKAQDHADQVIKVHVSKSEGTVKLSRGRRLTKAEKKHIKRQRQTDRNSDLAHGDREKGGNYRFRAELAHRGQTPW